jgi:hypothetical protein
MIPPVIENLSYVGLTAGVLSFWELRTVKIEKADKGEQSERTI